MNFRALVATAALLAAAVPSPAQLDRRSRDEPEIALDHGGRSGFCDVLKFDPTGKFLFAAGDDKAVSVWPVDADAKGGPRLNTSRAEVKTLRWPSWREKRGGIKMIAVDPTGDRVAVGGFGMLTSGVAILSRSESNAAGTTLTGYTWPRARPGKDDFGTVTAVAFDAEGKRVAFGTADGTVWVWTPTKLDKPDTANPDEPAREWKAPTKVGRHAQPEEWDAADLFTRPRLVFFRDADTVVSVSMSGEVVACDVSAAAKLSDDPAAAVPAVERLGHLNPNVAKVGRVYRAELTPDGKQLAVAYMGPRVRVCGLDGKGAVDLQLPEDHVPYGVAVEAKTGRVAVAVGGAKAGARGEPRFYLERANAVWVYDTATANAPAVKLPVSGRAEAVAFHPTPKGLLAVAGGDADEVQLFDLTAKDPTVATSTVRGAGRKAFAVGIGGGTTVAVKVASNPDAAHPNAAAAGEWIGFDLLRQKTTGVPNDLSTAVNEADGWTVTPDDDPDPKKRKRERWYAVAPGGGKVELVFDHLRYNDPTCYTFLPKGESDPDTRLLVGHGHGCSLFRLPAGKPPAGLEPEAVYVGHTAEVLSVAAAKDGTWCITGGADHTVAAFSLKPWADHPTLGAAFEVPNGKDEVRVKSLAVGSPAWESGLKVGDRVDRVVIGRKNVAFNRVIDDKLKQPVGTPAAAVAELGKPAKPGVEVYFEVDGPKDADRRRLTTVQQRPMWKWFPAFDDAKLTDSVVWMWKGSRYEAKSFGGDEMVGWHVNPPGVIGSPRFHRLKDFAAIYNTPQVVRDLLESRDVPAALNTALGKNPQPPSFARNEPHPVDLIVLNKQVAGGKAKLRLAVKPRGSDLDLLPDRVELWVNDHRYKRWDNPPGKVFDEAVEIDADDLRAGDNQLTVMAHNPRGGRVWDKDVATTTARPPANPTLVGWVGGVNDYTGHRVKLTDGVRAAFGELGELTKAVSDANAVSARFGEYSTTGKYNYFGDNRLLLRTDSAVGRKSLLDALDALAKKGSVKPDDTLVLFLAGHGTLIGDKGGKTVAVPAGEKRMEDQYANIRFLFCGPDFDFNNPVDTGVPAEVLFDKLVAVNCRKLVFLDVCHAGGMVDVDVVRRLLPDGQGPFVFAACGRGDLAVEDPNGQHGFFTSSLLEATGPNFRQADTNRDNELSCEELVAYCKNRVPALRLEMMKAKNPAARFSDQTPVSSLRRNDPLGLTAVVKRTEPK